MGLAWRSFFETRSCRTRALEIILMAPVPNFALQVNISYQNAPAKVFSSETQSVQIKVIQTVCKTKPRRACTSLVRKQNVKCDTLT